MWEEVPEEVNGVILTPSFVQNSWKFTQGVFLHLVHELSTFTKEKGGTDSAPCLNEFLNPSIDRVKNIFTYFQHYSTTTG